MKENGAPTEATGCNVCGSPAATPLYTMGGFRIVQCRQCQLIYAAPQPSADSTGNLYKQEEYFRGGMDVGYNFGYLTPETEAFVNYYYGQRLDIIHRFKPPGRLLDVGCAVGYFLRLAQDRGWIAIGLDISPFAVAYAREKFGCVAYVGTLDAAGFPDGSFDAVTMWDLIEHVRDPGTLLQQAHQVLKPGGLLALSTPNIESPNAELSRENYWQIRPREHLLYFPEATLRHLLRTAGFRIVHLTSSLMGPPLLPTKAFTRLSKRAAVITGKDWEHWVRLFHIGDNLEVYAVKEQAAVFRQDAGAWPRS